MIDAAKFFKRLIYELEIPSPTILTNPYEYFSKEINTLLPRNEDVLHLRHWTQRLKLLEKNNSKFEVAVRALEQHFLAKDYNSAAKILFSFDEMALSTADIEFIASFIIEFIDNESTIQPFDDRLSFHNASLNFAEHNLLQMSKTRLNVRVLKAILFLRFANSDKDKAASLIKEIYTLARTDNRLLEVELRALGILQCLSTDDRQNPHFSRAMKQIECLEPEEISGLVDWWNNTLLVGTEESKLALSIIYSEFHNG